MTAQPDVILLQAEGKRRSISYRTAMCQAELEDAFGLVYERYLELGLTRPNHVGLRVSRHHLLPNTHVLVAKCEANVLATVTLVVDSPWGLPIESLYGAAIDAMKADGERLAEVTCLAHRRPEEWLGLPVVERLMALMAQMAARKGVDRLIIGVNPRHAGFYRRIGFRVFDAVRPYPSVCGSLAVPMQVDLRSLATDHPAAHRRFFGKKFAPKVLRTTPMSPALLRHFSRIVLCNEADDEASGLQHRYAL